MFPLYVAWSDTTGKISYRGPSLQSQPLVEGVLFPAQYSDIQTVVLRNPAVDYRLQAQLAGIAVDGSAQTYANVKFYLTGDSATEVQQVWPVLGGGYEISFDQGANWTRFDLTHGLQSDPSSWIPLKGCAVADGASDGQLGPFPPYNQALLQLRLRVPNDASRFGVYNLSLGIDLDIL